MKLKAITICFLILLLGILFYPIEMTLAPKADLKVEYEDGKVARNTEVKRSWNSYVTNDGWTQEYKYTDEGGKVVFDSVKKRVPIIVERLIYYSTFLSMHENTSTVGSFTSRNPKNKFIWGRVDYNDENCCPEKLLLKKQTSKMSDSYFNIGKWDN